MKPGYSWNTVQENVIDAVSAGVPRLLAVREAYNAARKSFFKGSPNGHLPAWLAYSAHRTDRNQYDAEGKPILSNPRYAVGTGRGGTRDIDTDKYGRIDEFPYNIRHVATKKQLHPYSTPNMKRAAKLYEKFAGKPPTRIKKFPFPAIPREALVIGELLEVHYKSARDGLRYRHPFRKNSRPSLIATFDGKLVLIVGGRYAFTERGIVDK